MTIQTLVRIETYNNKVIELMQIDREYRIDSRQVAPGLNLQHESFMKTLSAYQAELEHFGVFRLEIGKPPKGSQGGRPETYALLNRNQVLFVITLSKNTKPVIQWKMAIIDALDQLEKQPRPYVVSAKIAEAGPKLSYLHHCVLEHYRPGLSYRQLGELIGVGKDKAGNLLKELRNWGFLPNEPQ